MKDGIEIKPPKEPGPWAIWDLNDESWVGNESGPLKYTDPMLARAALTILGICNWSLNINKQKEQK